MRRQALLILLLPIALAPVHALGRSGSPPMSLGAVHLSRAVWANGKPLQAGRYEIRLTGEEPRREVGESAGAEEWVEFLRGGSVVGRELATVISDADMASIAKSPRPEPNDQRVDLLLGGDYLRVWINRAGVNYLIDLRTHR